MPAIGLAAAIGYGLANDAGLDISQEAYQKAVRYHHDGSGEMGRILYGVGAGNVSAPREFEPEAVENGKMGTGNGSLAAAAVLFDLEGKARAAHLCSFTCFTFGSSPFSGFSLRRAVVWPRCAWSGSWALPSYTHSVSNTPSLRTESQ